MKLNALLIMTTLLSSFHAFSGEGTGTHGGGGHICYNSDKSIKSAVMYDLYEGVNRYEFPAKESLKGNFDEIMTNAISRVREVNPAFAVKIEAASNLMLREMQFTDKVLLDSNDAGKVSVDEGCTFGQVVTWDERVGKIKVNKKIYNAMKNLDKAALIFHEAVYYLARRYSYQFNSDDTREFVARVFLGQPIKMDFFAAHTMDIGVVDEPIYGAKTIKRINWEDPACYQYRIKDVGTELNVEISLGADQEYNQKFLITPVQVKPQVMTKVDVKTIALSIFESLEFNLETLSKYASRDEDSILLVGETKQTVGNYIFLTSDISEKRVQFNLRYSSKYCSEFYSDKVEFLWFHKNQQIFILQ